MTARRGDEGGIATIWAVGTTAAVVLFAGFLVDGIGVVLRTRSEAFSVAAAAARAGAQELDDTGAVGGEVSIDPAESAAAAQDYLAARDATGEVTVTGGLVTVNVVKTADLRVFPGSVSIDATATVEAVEATTGP